MNIVNTPIELQRALSSSRGKERIAFVPTMGCLHEGHASLIRKAKRLVDIVIVSIYVNPLQFAPNEDFKAYPRVFENDAKLCDNEGVNIIFHPDQLYPDHGSNITLKVDVLDQVLCGASRPNHFDGVVTVVNMLFNIVQPNIAIFGEKDWQQLAIIRRMVSDLHMPIEIVGSETLREKSGLALSSRNRYLSDEEKKRASIIYQTLNNMNSGESDCAALLKQAKEQLQHHHITPEYLEIRHANTLETLSSLKHEPARAFIAAKVGTTRLIDNIALEITP